MQPEPQPLNSPEDVEAIRRVIRQGGNPLVDTDVPRWEDQVGVSRIVNRRVVEIEPLPTPAQVLADMPLSETAQRVVVESRDAIRNVLHGRDDRLLVKPVPAAREILPHAPMEAPYPGAKQMLLVEEVDDRSFLQHLLVQMEPQLPEQKKKKAKGK